MHASPACFTWGNTASSAIFVLPQSEKHLPMLWWNAVTPCTGLYVPIFIAGDQLPPLLSKAGTAGKTVTPPPEVKEDQYQDKSYWWLFRTCWIESKAMSMDVGSWAGKESPEKRSTRLKGTGRCESQKQKRRR